MARQKQIKACKRCGVTPLTWKSFDGSWVLADVNGERHICAGSTPRAPRTVTPHFTPVASAILEPVAPVAPDFTLPTIEPSATGDAGAALYALVRPHAVQDTQTLISSAVKQAMQGFEPNAPIAPLQVIIGATGEVVATIQKPHKQCARLVKQLSRKFNVLLVGPAGSGKTNACEHAAEALSLKFYAQSVGAQTSKSDFVGFMDVHGRIVSPIFRMAYEFGGLYLLDEIDAGNANVLTLLNAALANGYCAFPDGMVKRHPDFRCVAAANTFGNGANRQYVGRNQLDAATTDRFVKIAWTYDEAIETSLGRKDWTRYIHSLRQAADETGVRVIFSTRAIINGSIMLNDGDDRDEVEMETLWNGVSVDDRAKLAAHIARQ